MQLLRLKIKNFMSISDVEIQPGAVNQVVGNNNNGKTTILKALDFAINGSSDGKLVKFGEDSAEVIVELSDNTHIRRRINQDGRQSVSVKNGEGFNAPSPQNYLEALFDQSSFNPLELLEPKRRAEAILKALDVKVTPERLAEELSVPVKNLPPIDFKQHGLQVLEQVRKYYFQRRAEANKDVADKKHRWETYKNDLPEDIEAPAMDRKSLLSARDEEVDKVLIENEHLHRLRMERIQIDKAHAKVVAYRTEKAEVEHKIAALQERLAMLAGLAEVCMNEIPKDMESSSVHSGLIEAAHAKIKQLDQSLGDWEKFDLIKKQNEMVQSMHVEMAKAKKFADALGERVTALGGPIKSKIMSETELPVPGLEFRDEVFFVDGVPVDNLSSSMAMKLAIGIARKLAKKSKLICLDGVEALDEKTYADLREEIEGDGFQYFLTRVGGCFAASKNDTIIPMEKGAVVQ